MKPSYFYLYPQNVFIESPKYRFKNTNATNQPLFKRQLSKLQCEKASIYIHIPFCKGLCHYCPYYKLPYQSDKVSNYFDLLLKELALYKQNLPAQKLKISTIYFGGGTPSVLSIDQISSIFADLNQTFNIQADTEITFEGEARSLLSQGKIFHLKKMGVTRISYGVQTFDPKIRQNENLLTSFKQIQRCADLIHENEIDLAFDLMFGFSGQTYESWSDTLQKAFKLNGDQIYVWRTFFNSYPHRKDIKHHLTLNLPTIEERYKMHLLLLDQMREAGYIQDNIVTFRKKDKPVYWFDDQRSQSPVTIALGSSSMGQFGGMGYYNIADIEKYEQYLQKGNFPFMSVYEKVDYNQHPEYRIIYDLTVVGVMRKADYNWGEIEKTYGKRIKKLKEKYLVFENQHELRLSDLGKFWATNLSSHFYTNKDIFQLFIKIFQIMANPGFDFQIKNLPSMFSNLYKTMDYSLRNDTIINLK